MRFALPKPRESKRRVVCVSTFVMQIASEMVVFHLKVHDITAGQSLQLNILKLAKFGLIANMGL